MPQGLIVFARNKGKIEIFRSGILAEPYLMTSFNLLIMVITCYCVITSAIYQSSMTNSMCGKLFHSFEIKRKCHYSSVYENKQALFLSSLISGVFWLLEAKKVFLNNWFILLVYIVKAVCQSWLIHSQYLSFTFLPRRVRATKSEAHTTSGGNRHRVKRMLPYMHENNNQVKLYTKKVLHFIPVLGSFYVSVLQIQRSILPSRIVLPTGFLDHWQPSWNDDARTR